MLRLKTAFRNRMATNHITDIFIVFPPVFPCGVWDEAQQRYASTVIFENEKFP